MTTKTQQLACFIYSIVPRFEFYSKAYHFNPVIYNRFISAGAVIANLTRSQAANNVLASAIDKHPSRFGGWALVPISDPTAAADELSRSVEQLGFVGALVNNHDQGRFYDNQTYWPFFARAQDLNVPIYLHPANPPEVWESRFQGSYPNAVSESLGSSGWDWRKSILDSKLLYSRTSGGKIILRSLDLSFSGGKSSRNFLESDNLV